MTKRQQKRIRTLLPNGIPKYVRVYDSPSNIDRYTVVYSGKYRTLGLKRGERIQSWFQYVGMSGAPFHPQGVGMHGEHPTLIDVDKWGFPPAMGRKNHLGKRVSFDSLPEDCKKLVRQDYIDLWNL